MAQLTVIEPLDMIGKNGQNLVSEDMDLSQVE